jgi:pimeloyl-ACP methyl ester carboxylesterase
MKDSQVKVGDGRELAFTDIGDPDGACIFFFHGAPMSRLHLAGLEEQFAAQGLRVVAPDRPSYGRSSPQPGRSMADWPQDVAALADVLGIDRFLVAAHSSGGPYAVACAALLPERVTAGAVVAGVTDMAWPGAWDGYVEDEIQIMHESDETAAIAWCTERYGADGSGFLAAEPFEFPEPDLAVLDDEMFVQALIEAFRQGVTGYAQDVHVQGRPWPFDPSLITAPMEVIHGELDTLLPLAHSRHTAEVIPSSTFRMLPGHGHLSILSELPTVASALNLAGDHHN